jgi:6-phosphogluconolactonase
MAVRINLLEFSDRIQAAEAAAELMEQSIQRSLETQEDCSIVVSGGSTPGPCFDKLSMKSLDWSRVTVIPSDERWVPPNHPDSNERLIRERLLVNEASAGQVLPLFRTGVEASEAPALVRQDLAERTMPASCALLGMGEDGHFASLFPDFSRLQHALDPDNDEPCLVVSTASSPHLRISLSLAFLLRSRVLILLISGAAKRRVLDAAAAGNTAYPIESLIRQAGVPLTVVWSP